MKAFILLWLFLPLAVMSQNLSQTDVAKVKVRNTGVVVKHGVVKGYYYFYNVDKKDKKINNYLLKVVDENLREINSVTIARPTNYVLIESTYNEQAFVFLFFDTRAKTTEMISYDNSLAQIGSQVWSVGGNSIIYSYQNIALGNEAQQRYLLPVDEVGFILYQPGSITFYDNSLKKVWDSRSDNQSGAVPSEGFVSDRLLGSIVEKDAGAKDLEFDLLVNDLNSGELRFQASLRTHQFNVIPNDITYDSAREQIVVFGEYFDTKDKALKAQSSGFCYLMFSTNGTLIDSKPIPWSDISQHAPVNKYGKFDGLNSNILFHEFIHTADGQIFAIGEQYKKVASGAGIGLKALQIVAAATTGYYSGGGSTVQMNVYNMVIFQFNSDYSLEKVHIFEKDKSQIMLPSGSTYQSAKLLSFYVKARGGFDYRFSQEFPGGESFAVVYVDAQGSKSLLGAIVYTPEKTFVVDKINFDKRSTDYAVLRAKPGYILIAEYAKKEKKLDMRLEKINY